MKVLLFISLFVKTSMSREIDRTISDEFSAAKAIYLPVIGLENKIIYCDHMKVNT